ncbi:hypothetical protein KIW84_051874 [Lathyrus oleraceus]|uniref:Chromo domain-containing protein n=1 Tax=Pisum sativum TaxID=3888 RepID=A0A9D4WQA1_PEA|nr:hypothetical protein KIW84_051874 [Pisum sativum]
MEVCIGEFKLDPEMHLFELGGIDVVLGIEWLKTLGDTTTNWKQQTMSFWNEKRWVTLKGQEGCRKSPVALQNILSKPRPHMQDLLWTVEKTKPKEAKRNTLSAQLQRELETVLRKYDQVFQTVLGLPPKRNKEHAINLVEGQGAVNVRPYRYPHHHKSEIEKQSVEYLGHMITEHGVAVDLGKVGKLNKGADALSRIHEGGELATMNYQWKWLQEEQIKIENQQDERLQRIIAGVQQNAESWPGYEYKQGVLMYEGRLVISNKSLLIPTLLEEFHSTPQGGHSGFYKTYRRLAANVYWIGMKGTVQDFVRRCDICQRQKYIASSPGVYGRPPPKLIQWTQGETRVEVVQRDLLDRDEALRQLRNQLLRAQEKMKSQANKKRTDRSFACVEWVFVKLRAHRQQSAVTRISAKLAARYYGPYPIIEKIGVVAYRLKLPEGSRVHPVFHVSLLKKVVGHYHEEDELPDLLEEQTKVYEPEAVLATRKVKKQDEEIRQILVHWKGKIAEEATWEDEIMIRSQFPKFGLEDKAIAEGEGIDRPQLVEKELPREQLMYREPRGPQTWKVYSRRKGKKGIGG